MPNEAYRCELPTYKIAFSKNILFYMNGGLSKIRSVLTYVLKGFILVVSTVFVRFLYDVQKRLKISNDMLYLASYEL